MCFGYLGAAFAQLQRQERTWLVHDCSGQNSISAYFFGFETTGNSTRRTSRFTGQLARRSSA